VLEWKSRTAVFSQICFTNWHLCVFFFAFENDLVEEEEEEEINRLPWLGQSGQAAAGCACTAAALRC
jgi:hypothetical protein